MLYFISLIVCVFISAQDPFWAAIIALFSTFLAAQSIKKVNSKLSQFNKQNIRNTDLYNKITNQINKLEVGEYVNQKQLNCYIEKHLTVELEAHSAFIWPFARLKTKQVLRETLKQINIHSDLDNGHSIRFDNKINQKVSIPSKTPNNDFTAKKV